MVQEYHNVLWSGPIHERLKEHLHWSLEDWFRSKQGVALRIWNGGESDRAVRPFEQRLLDNGLLLRWINSLSRVLVNIQHYRHGGGLLIVPDESLAGLNIKYRLKYDRLLAALIGLVQHRLGSAGTVADDFRAFHRSLDEHRSEVLGAVRFIASLASVDGVVLLRRNLGVRGFGVELRTNNPLSEIFLAGDASGCPDLMRDGDLTHFGTRHRAMMRYCQEHDGTLGLVVSQDGDIQAMTRIGERLVVWENIDVQLGFAAGESLDAAQAEAPILRRFIARAT